MLTEKNLLSEARNCVLLIAVGFAAWCSVAIAESQLPATGGVRKSEVRPDLIYVIDGDTLRIGQERIRILGLDTPELRTYDCLAELMLAKQAKAYVESRLKFTVGDVVIVRDRSKDRYGRTLAHVYIDDRSLAAEIIEVGLGVPWKGRQEDWCVRLKR